MPYRFSWKDCCVALRICGSYKHTLFWMDHTWHRTPWLSEDILHSDYLDMVPHAEAITANIWTRLQVAKQNPNSPLNNTKQEIAAAHSQTCNLWVMWVWWSDKKNRTLFTLCWQILLLCQEILISCCCCIICVTHNTSQVRDCRWHPNMIPPAVCRLHVFDHLHRNDLAFYRSLWETHSSNRMSLFMLLWVTLIFLVRLFFSHIKNINVQ